jgi:hypothetical protein
MGRCVRAALADLSAGQQQATVDGEHCPRNVGVLHQVEVGQGDLLRLPDRAEKCVLYQAGEDGLTLRLGNPVPQRQSTGATRTLARYRWS